MKENLGFRPILRIFMVVDVFIDLQLTKNQNHCTIHCQRGTWRLWMYLSLMYRGASIQIVCLTASLKISKTGEQFPVNTIVANSSL